MLENKFKTHIRMVCISGLGCQQVYFTRMVSRAFHINVDVNVVKLKMTHRIWHISYESSPYKIRRRGSCDLDVTILETFKVDADPGLQLSFDEAAAFNLFYFNYDTSINDDGSYSIGFKFPGLKNHISKAQRFCVSHSVVVDIMMLITRIWWLWPCHQKLDLENRANTKLRFVANSRVE